jgi:plasmid stabilization system protein ParE
MGARKCASLTAVHPAGASLCHQDQAAVRPLKTRTFHPLDSARRPKIDIHDELHKLADIGHGGANRDWLAPNLRFTVLGRYSIYYRLTATETIVLRFLHGYRDLSGMDFSTDESS